MASYFGIKAIYDSEAILFADISRIMIAYVCKKTVPLRMNLW